MTPRAGGRSRSTADNAETRRAGAERARAAIGDQRKRAPRAAIRDRAAGGRSTPRPAALGAAAARRGAGELAQDREPPGPARSSARRASSETSYCSSAEAMLVEHAQQLDRDRAALIAERQAWERTACAAAAGHRRAPACRRGGSWPTAARAWKPGRSGSSGRRPAWSRSAAKPSRCTGSRSKCGSGRAALVADQRPPVARRSDASARPVATEAGRAVPPGRAAASTPTRGAGGARRADRRAASRAGAASSGLREWAAARQAEIEEQAAALVQRELASTNSKRRPPGAARLALRPPPLRAANPRPRLPAPRAPRRGLSVAAASIGGAQSVHAPWRRCFRRRYNTGCPRSAVAFTGILRCATNGMNACG